MSRRERVLLVLTVIAFVVPTGMVVLFAARHGLTISGYLRHWGESLPATQLAVDLSITFLAFALWAAWEGRRLGMRSWWWPLPASLLVGLCFAVSLFLLLRERTVGRQASPGRTDSRETPPSGSTAMGR
jgi:putative Ca2+/H+ antiporter (TMEM165/GDT1 family)